MLNCGIRRPNRTPLKGQPVVDLPTAKVPGVYIVNLLSLPIDIGRGGDLPDGSEEDMVAQCHMIAHPPVPVHVGLEKHPGVELL